MTTDRTRLKVCCIADEGEADLAIAHGADCIGLVAEMPSGPGPIPDAQIAAVARHVGNRARRFLLTSRTTPEAIAEHVHAVGVDTVQLVDAVPRLAELRAMLPGVRLVQVIHVRGEASFDEALALAPHVDELLLDSGNPNAAVRELGGTGRTHDWSVSARIVAAVAPMPVFLAGGLRAHNVAEAIAAVRPHGVDLCSGVRREGKLSAEMLGEFVAAMG